MTKELNTGKNKKRRRRRRRRRSSPIASALLILLVFVLLVGGTLFVLSNRMLNRIERVDKAQEVWLSPEEATIEADDDEQEDGPKADTIDPDTLQWTKPAQAPQVAKVKNILLIGQDKRGGETRARSDSMILCSLNEDTGEITLASLMRDMFVPFPGDYKASRMNHAYAWGGMSLLDQLIEEDFGVVIDGNLEVDFQGFVKVMDMIGPLEIELKDYEVGYMNRHTKAGFQAGPNMMNGDQLLVYARMRHVGKADWERTDRQRTVLTKAFEKVKKLSVKEIFELADAALPYMSTDLSNFDIYGLIYRVLSKRMTIGGTYRIPLEGTYTAEIVYGMDVLVADLQANSDFLLQTFYRK